MNLHDMLGRVPLFQELPAPDLAELCAALVKRLYSKGQTIFHKDDDGNGLYLVGRGKVKVTLPGAGGEEVLIAIVTTGELIGELSLIDGGKRSATVTALEDAELYYLGREKFIAFLASRFDSVMIILRVLAGRLRDTNSLLEDAHLCDITTRVARRIMMLGKQFGICENGTLRIDMLVTQSDLASMTGATRESINKQLRSFREKGLIKIEKGHVVVLDAQRLARKARMNIAPSAT